MLKYKLFYSIKLLFISIKLQEKTILEFIIMRIRIITVYMSIIRSILNFIVRYRLL